MLFQLKKEFSPSPPLHLLLSSPSHVPLKDVTERSPFPGMQWIMTPKERLSSSASIFISPALAAEKCEIMDISEPIVPERHGWVAIWRKFPDVPSPDAVVVGRESWVAYKKTSCHVPRIELWTGYDGRLHFEQIEEANVLRRMMIRNLTRRVQNSLNWVDWTC